MQILKIILRPCVLICTIFTVITSPLVFAKPEIELTECDTHISYLEDSVNYFPDLLKLVLEKSVPKFGCFTLSAKPAISTKERMRKLLADNQYFDVLWSNSNQQRDRELLPVKFDILKGLNQYKLLLIRPEMQCQFKDISTLSDLSRFIGMVLRYCAVTD
ncbi:hypothetical protein [Catenovulum sediminis]|uniref:hypothetical protein n=1 Tax=Catenovulum sediminis TaxID=1740262 RepID=UPI0011806858|nr:hypothetical protein [Catenovulum sediminis]